MGITGSTVRVGQKPPKDAVKRLGKIAKRPVSYTEDCPPLSPEALKEFARLAAERNRRRRKQSVTIRVSPDILENYKTMGDGYTGIMADVLKYAIENPDVLAKAARA